MAQLWTMRVSYDDRLFFDEDVIGLDWRDVGDVQAYGDEGALQDSLDARAVQGGLDEGDREARRERGSGWGRQAWAFAHAMKVGDLVLVRFGFQEVVQVAEVAGDYVFNGDAAPPLHSRAVRWIKRDLPLASLHGEVHVPFPK